jgi:hypothetical protein
MVNPQTHFCFIDISFVYEIDRLRLLDLDADSFHLAGLALFNRQHVPIRPFKRERPPLRGRTETLVRLDGIEPERRADVPRNQHPGGGFHHPVELILRQLRALVGNAIDPKAAIEQLDEKLFASHRVVSEVML